MKFAKKLLATCLAVTIALSGVVLNTEPTTVEAADPVGVRATIYNIPAYVHDGILEEDGWGVSLDLESNAQFDETIDGLLEASYEVGVPKPGITAFPYIEVVTGPDDYYIREWKGTMTIKKSGTYTMVGQAIDNGFAMRIKPQGAADEEFKTVYEYWGASHWFPQYPILGPLPYPDGAFTAEAGDVFDVEMYYLDLDYGEVLEMSAQCDYADGTSVTIKLYDDLIYETEESRAENAANREATFAFDLTERNYNDIADPDHIDELIGLGHASEGAGNGGNGAQCIEENFKFHESIDTLLSLATKGETFTATSFITSLNTIDCLHCNYDGDSYIIMYEGTLTPRNTGWYRIGASQIDNGFYMEIDPDPIDGEDTQGYQTVYELWAGKTWNDNTEPIAGVDGTYAADTVYPTGIYLTRGKTYTYRAAYLETEGTQSAEIVAYWNQNEDSISGKAPSAITSALRFYASDVEEAGDDYPFTPPTDDDTVKAPKLSETKDDILYHADFLDEATSTTVASDSVKVQQITNTINLADPTNDPIVDVPRDEDGYMLMAENQYINLGLDMLKGKTNVSIEFVVKPAQLPYDHIAFAGIGNESEEDPNWVVMGYHQDGSLKFGMKTTAAEVGDALRSSPDKLVAGTWTTVKYEFTGSTVTIYADGSPVYRYDITSQKSLGQIVDGGFIFGKELRFGDTGFEGSIAEIRVSSSKALDKTDQQVLFYTDFTDVADMIVKEAAGPLPNLETDEETAIELDDDGHMVMYEAQYIDLNFDLLKGKDNAVIEFVVKPSSLSDMAFAGLGTADDGIVMDMTANGAVRYSEYMDGAANFTTTSASSLLAQDQWSVVQYVINEGKVKVYVDGILVRSPVEEGNVLEQLADGELIFGKEFKDGIAGFEGVVSEIRVTTMPVLDAVEEEVLFYTDFSTGTLEQVNLKEATGEPNDRGLIVPDVTNDTVLNVNDFINENGYLVMGEQQYIDLGLDLLEDKNNVTLEFVVKPSVLNDHRAIAGIGSSDIENNYAIMGMMGTGAMKLGMKTNTLDEVGFDDYSDTFPLAAGVWTKVKYEFTAFKVSVYVNDQFVYAWDTTGQRTLSEITDGEFLFGKEPAFGDLGFTGEISELRVSAFKTLESTEKEIVYYTDFTNEVNVKEVADAATLPAPETDSDVVADLDAHGHLLMTGTQYIDLNLAALQGKENVKFEFVVKPTEIADSAFATIGNTDNWISMSMTADGAVQYAMQIGEETVTVASPAGALLKNQWSIVAYEFTETAVNVYVEGALVATAPVADGDVLAKITDGAFLFGKAVHTTELAGYAGYVSEIRVTSMMTLGETDGNVLYYTDFSAESDGAVVKESANNLPNTATDLTVNANLSNDGFLKMTAQQYIDIGLAELEGNDRIFMEFIIKPSAIVDHAAFAGIGDETNWIVMGMRWDNALKFGQQSNGMDQAGTDQTNTTSGLLAVGEWALVQYEFSPENVKAYMNGELVYTWDITGQYTLSQFTEGGFIFGKELRWGDAGYEGVVSEIRVSTFKALGETDEVVVLYSDFSTTDGLTVKEAADALPNPDTDAVVAPVINEHEHLVLTENQYIDFGLDSVAATDNATVEFIVEPSEIRESAITGLGNSEKWMTIGMDDEGHVTYSINVGNGEVSGVSTDVVFVKDYWTIVQYKITETKIEIFVEGQLAVSVPVPDGNVLQEITEGGVILGKDLHAAATGFTGIISEIRVSVIPSLGELEAGERELFYTDFSDVSALTVKQSSGVPNPTSDISSSVVLDEDGYMQMSRDQYINLGLELLKDKKNVTIEFVVKPEVVAVHHAFAGVGAGEDNWIVMGMGENSSIKFGMDTTTTAGEICAGEHTAANSFVVDKWVKIRYEFTPTTVTGYINDVEARVWNITGQRSLAEITEGSFVFGKESKWGDAGLEGKISEVRVSTTDVELFDIYTTNMTLGNDLSINFYVEKADLNGENYYAKIIKTYADGQENVEEIIPYSEWESYNSSLMRFTFNGIAAKEMSDEIYVEVYNSDGTIASNLYTESVVGYAMAIYDIADDSLKTLIVDMLNYGAAAQEYFGYDVENLANAGLTAEQQAYATKEAKECESILEYGEGYYATSISLKSNILLTMYFDNISPDMYAVVSYTDHYGNAKEITINGEDFYVRTDGLVGVDINTLVVADSAVAVTCTVYDAEGNPVTWATDSIESYLAGNTAVVYTEAVKFTNSAYNYFHK